MPLVIRGEDRISKALREARLEASRELRSGRPNGDGLAVIAQQSLFDRRVGVRFTAKLREMGVL